MSGEEGQNLGMSVEVEGKGTASDPQEPQKAVDYGGGAPAPAPVPAEDTMEGIAGAPEKEQAVEEPQQGEESQGESESPMEELADEGDVAPLDTAVEASPRAIDESKAVEEPTLSESKRPGFDSSSVQPALSDSDNEGGIAKTSSAVGMKNFKGVEEEGSLLKPRPDLEAESESGAYEVSGFTVSYEPKKGEGLTSVQIRDYFADMETAMASINDNKYLMPMPGSGYKIATVTSGAPSISFEERQLYEYINGKWRKS